MSFFRAGIFYALAAALGLGAITTQAKLVYADGGNALTLMFWRFAMSIIIIGALILIRRESFKVDKPLVRPVILLGLIWSGSMICYLMAVETISVSLAVLILYSYPILVLLISMFIGRIDLSAKTAGVFMIAFVGIGLMLSGGELKVSPLGILFAFLGACGATYTFLSGSRVASQFSPVVVAFWVNFMGIFLIMPLVIGKFFMPVSITGLLLLAGATGCYIIASICQFQALSTLPAEKAAFIFNFEPVVSILLAVLFIGERLSSLQWLGATIVLIILLGFAGLTGQNKVPAKN